MTIVEIEQTFAEFSSQLQSLKDKHKNREMTDKIAKLITETQVTKLEVMRLNCNNKRSNKQLSESVSQHINDLHNQIIILKQSLEPIIFEA